MGMGTYQIVPCDYSFSVLWAAAGIGRHGHPLLIIAFLTAKCKRWLQPVKINLESLLQALLCPSAWQDIPTITESIIFSIPTKSMSWQRIRLELWWQAYWLPVELFQRLKRHSSYVHLHHGMYHVSRLKSPWRNYTMNKVLTRGEMFIYTSFSSFRGNWCSSVLLATVWHERLKCTLEL